MSNWKMIEDQEGRSFLVFPTAEAIARLEVEEMRIWQFSQRKAECIIDFARAVVSGTVDLERLQAMEDEEVIEYLSKLRGIGRWTVGCLLLISGYAMGFSWCMGLRISRMRRRFGGLARVGGLIGVM